MEILKSAIVLEFVFLYSDTSYKDVVRLNNCLHCTVDRHSLASLVMSNRIEISESIIGILKSAFDLKSNADSNRCFQFPELYKTTEYQRAIWPSLAPRTTCLFSLF